MYLRFLLPSTSYTLKREAEMSSATSVAKPNPEIAPLSALAVRCKLSQIVLGFGRGVIY